MAAPDDAAPLPALSAAETAETLKGWYLLRGYSADFDPLSTVMDLPRDEAIATMKAVHPTRGIGDPDANGHRDQTKYYELRAAADKWVGDNSTAIKDRDNPIFMALTRDPETVRRHMNSPGNNVLLMPLADMDPAKLSITFDDSMGNYRTTVLDTKNTGINGEFLPDISPVHGKVMNVAQFAAAIKTHGMNDASGGPRTIEAQYWGKDPLKAQIIPYDPDLPKPPRPVPAAADKTPDTHKPATAEKPSAHAPDAPEGGHARGAQAKLGRAAGRAQMAVDVASGNYAAAATSAATEIALNAKTYEAAAELTASIAPVAKAVGFVGKRVPVVGAAVTAGFVLWEAASYALEGKFGKATAALGAGAAETAGNLIGFGAGDAAREAVRGVVIAAAGDEYAVNKSGLRQLGEGAIDVGSKFVSGTPGATPEEKKTTSATAAARPKAPGM